MTILLFVYHSNSIVIVVHHIDSILYVAWPITVKNTCVGQRVNWCKELKRFSLCLIIIFNLMMNIIQLMLETNYVLLECKAVNVVKGLMCSTHIRAIKNNVICKGLTFLVVGTQRVNASHG